MKNKAGQAREKGKRKITILVQVILSHLKNCACAAVKLQLLVNKLRYVAQIYTKP